ncbi:MAG: ABC transporter substrate-binding protein [Eubacteriales bacterium]|nr:ABC transporter substrate-binding protein [Eubacteriales bacterium]
MKAITKNVLSSLLLVSVTVTALSGVGEAKGEEKTVVNIGTMNLVNGDLIAQYEAYYENELDAEVHIIQFDSGKDVNIAMAAGSIDISELGSSPTALGLSNGTDYQVFWIGDIIGAAESLAVTEESGITDIQDLVGKTIATPFASTAHYSLLNAIQEAGLSENDVTLLDLQPSAIFAAWQRGDVDGAYVWYPVLDELLSDGGKVITHSGELAKKDIITGDLNVVRSAYAMEHPDIVTNYVKAQIKANEILLNEPDKAAEEIAAILEIEKEDAAEQITQFEYLTAQEQIDFIENKLPQTLKNTGDFLVTQKSIKDTLDLEGFADRVTTKFIEAAIE